MIPVIRNPDVAGCICPEVFPEGKPFPHFKCEGCDGYTDALDALVYPKQGQWFATHIGCGMVPIGPFDSEEDARIFQKITLAPLATLEQMAQFNPPPVFGQLWLSVTKWFRGKVWYLVRHSSGRIMSEDRYEPGIRKDGCHQL
jgi:hypothetical protein